MSKLNELNSLKDINRPLPSIPGADPHIPQETLTTSQFVDPASLGIKRGPTALLRQSPGKNPKESLMNSKQAFYLPETYSSNEEWVSPETMSKRIETDNVNASFPSLTNVSSYSEVVPIIIQNQEIKSAQVLYMSPQNNNKSDRRANPATYELPLQYQKPPLGSRSHTPSISQSFVNPEELERHSYQPSTSLKPVHEYRDQMISESGRVNHRANGQEERSKSPLGGLSGQERGVPDIIGSLEKLRPHLNEENSNVKDSGRRSNSPSLSPMGMKKFQNMSNKSLMRMNSKESLHMTNETLEDTVKKLDHLAGPIEIINFEDIQKGYQGNSFTGGYTGDQTFGNNQGTKNQRREEIQAGSGTINDSSRYNKRSSVPSERAVVESNLQVSDDGESTKNRVLVLNGGLFFPQAQFRDQKTPSILTESEIYCRFRELEEDIRPHFDSVVCSPTETLLLDKPRSSFLKGMTKSKINLFDSYTSSGFQNHFPNIKSSKGDSEFTFRSLIEKQLSHKFDLLHALPFHDPFGSKGEFFLVTNKEDQSISILKALYTGELGSQDSKSSVILTFKLGDSTLSQILNNKKRAYERFKVSELRSLFFDCVTSFYTLQKEGQSLISLHPDFILFDSENQIFYVLPITFMPDYDSRNHGTRLFSLTKAAELKASSNREQTPLFGHPSYFSPVLREAYDRSSKECNHNPYKSCLFSLGLILLEAFTLKPIDSLNQSKSLLYDLIAKNPLYLTSSIIGKDYLIHCPNILRVILTYEEEERPDFIQLYFRIFKDLPAFEDPLHPKLSPPILDNQAMQQLQMSKKLGPLKVSLTFAKGQKYVGQVQEYNSHIIRHGQGSFYNEHGDLIFQGVWNQDFPKEGSFIYNEDYRYEGRWGGFFHDGYGRLYFKETPLYEGGWQEFKYHGQGKLYYQNGSLKYEGEFRLSMKHGFGRLHYKNGNIYHMGSYREDKMDGRGTLYWPNGDLKFEGEILCDDMDGVYLKGKYYTERVIEGKTKVYVGELLNDKQHGKGALYDEEGNVLAAGDWVFGELRCTSDQNWRKDSTAKCFSLLKLDIEQQKGLHLEVNFNNAHINQDNHEVELNLDFHAPQKSLSVDLSTIDYQSLKIAYDIVAKSPYFQHVKSITISKFLDQKVAGELKFLLTSSNLKELQRILVKGTSQFSDALCLALSDSLQSFSLKELAIVEAGSFSEEGLERIITSTALANLNSLRLKNLLSIKEHTIVVNLSKAFYLRKLTKLCLSQCSLTADCLKILFNLSSFLSGIKELNLSRNAIGNRGCQHILESKARMESLVKLNLKECCIEPPGVSFLSNTECLENVRSLNLSGNQIANPGCEFIFTSRVFAKLERIALKDCSIGLQGLKRMAGSPNVRNLVAIVLDENKGINNEGLDWIAENSNLGNLEELSIIGTSTTIKGIEKLCRSSNLERLKILKIFGNELGKLVGKEVRKEMNVRGTLELL